MLIQACMFFHDMKSTVGATRLEHTVLRYKLRSLAGLQSRLGISSYTGLGLTVQVFQIVRTMRRPN